ncbi:MAG: RluA family pseudouridine synthase [Defluviitaleaceae bacterium]|nr:RluA family pseudouridine synthase [Defluviitaleaceae bacterium]
MEKFTIGADGGNQRLGKFLGRLLPAAPKSLVQKLLRKKVILLNGARAEAAQMLAAGDEIVIFLAADTFAALGAKKAAAPPGGRVDAIYEDDFILIANKPANLLTQPNAPGGDSLLGRVRAAAEGDFAPVAINRLDRNTTGLVIFAKTLAAAQILSEIFRKRDIGKIYLGMVCGKINENLDLTGFHTKDAAQNRATISDFGNGKISKTRAEPLEYFPKSNTTLLRIELITGHSHQIRAHLASIGHPIVGDGKYGAKPGRRPLLHAHQIRFNAPPPPLQYLKNRHFEAAIPKDIILFCK